MIVRCHHCHRPADLRECDVARARAGGFNLYCGRRCAGLGRRKWTPVQKRQRKAAYDRARRVELADHIKREKHAYYVSHRNPTKEKARRKRLRNWHRAYIADYNAKPANKARKAEYDRDRRADLYGAFADAHKILTILSQTICQLVPDKYERLKARGYFTRKTAQQRRRDAQNTRH